jgi:hypothetical protein
MIYKGQSNITKKLAFDCWDKFKKPEPGYRIKEFEPDSKFDISVLVLEKDYKGDFIKNADGTQTLVKVTEVVKKPNLNFNEANKGFKKLFTSYAKADQGNIDLQSAVKSAAEAIKAIDGVNVSNYKEIYSTLIEIGKETICVAKPVQKLKKADTALVEEKPKEVDTTLTDETVVE